MRSWFSSQTFWVDPWVPDRIQTFLNAFMSLILKSNILGASTSPDSNILNAHMVLRSGILGASWTEYRIMHFDSECVQWFYGQTYWVHPVTIQNWNVHSFKSSILGASRSNILNVFRSSIPRASTSHPFGMDQRFTLSFMKTESKNFKTHTWFSGQAFWVHPGM